MTVVGAVSLVLTLGPQAAAQPGNGDLSGRSVLAVGGCGRQRASFGTAVVVEGAGTWSALDSEGQPFTGTWMPRGGSDRKLDLAFDPETEAAFVAALVSDVAELCETVGPITVRSVERKVFTLAANRKRTRATLVLRYAVSGRTSEGSGTARYRVKAKGPWTPAPLP